MQVHLKNSKLHLQYQVYGEGHTILVLHGFMLDHTVMRACLEPIFAAEANKSWRRYYVDLPGMGASEPTTTPSSDAMLQAIAEFVTTMPTGPITLIGYSYGAYIALGLLRLLKSRIHSVLLICPVTVALKAKRTLPPALPIEATDEYLAISKQCSELEREIFDAFAVKTRSCWERFQKEAMVGIKRANWAFLTELEKNYEFSDEKQLLSHDYGDWQGKFMILCGRHDNVVGYEDHLPLLRAFPSSSFHVLDQAGHNLQIEQPLMFESLVKNWLTNMHQPHDTNRGHHP